MGMITQAASFKSPCSYCGQEGTGWNVQLVRDAELFWETELECHACGLVVHDGDPGAAPEKIRESLLLQHGNFLLRLEEPVGAGVKILKVFRDALGGSMAEAKEHSRKLSAGEFEGTSVELRFLRDRFLKEGIEVLIEDGPPIR
ncbi:hypothetical protein [Streptomyces sp. NPDC058622]|uniref:hypothetical protein n=1 Tax=Streptomyces sp. NPDC058622 TaxID=3346562 RepID=UPI0036684E45